MKRVIDGKTYNIDASTAVLRYQAEARGGTLLLAVAYQTRGGAFFTAYTGIPGGDGPLIEVTRRQDLEETAKGDHPLGFRLHEIEVLDQAAIDGAPGEEVTMILRMPSSLKRRLDETAKAAGVSSNALALRGIERACEGAGATQRVCEGAGALSSTRKGQEISLAEAQRITAEGSRVESEAKAKARVEARREQEEKQASHKCQVTGRFTS